MPSHRIPTRLLPRLAAGPSDRGGGGGGVIGWSNQGPTGCDIHGVGPLSYAVAVTRPSSTAICQQGRDAAAVRQSQGGLMGLDYPDAATAPPGPVTAVSGRPPAWTRSSVVGGGAVGPLTPPSTEPKPRTLRSHVPGYTRFLHQLNSDDEYMYN